MPPPRPRLRPRARAEDLAPVWKALADPTRRAILDLLRQAPRTTGDLADRFALSRFGVMKHLGILVEAGLVTVRREGRLRWNALNPMPIHQIYRRWIRPFETAAADRLMRLKLHAEALEEAAMTGTATFRSLDIKLEVEIAAPPARVWTSLTSGVGEWWPGQFYVGTAPKRFLIEPRVGGRVFEDWGDGEGVLFATVVIWEEGRTLSWAGDMSAEYGGPARSVTSFRLRSAADGGRTVVAFRDTPYGLLSDEAMQHLEHGWRWLLNDCLRPFLEQGIRPERPATLEA
ncbi:MAG TPA: metalloregulator ArsR/SmtB family transcription factor [Gemmatimonadales bacterium]|nr:metalloregulator ArsR/SmtB family transcription factor [Gemmatimonadales bacterium]